MSRQGGEGAEEKAVEFKKAGAEIYRKELRTGSSVANDKSTPTGERLYPATWDEVKEVE